MCIGLFFTIIAFKPITRHRPPDWDTEGLKKWNNAQKLYRVAGPIMLIGAGVMLLSELL